MGRYVVYPSYKLCNADRLDVLPSHWSVAPLRRLLTVPLVNGLFKKREFWGGGVKIVNVFDAYIKGDLVDETALDRVICDDSELKKYLVMHGDFVFVRSSLKLEGIGKAASILNPTEDLVFECHLVRGRPDTNQIDPAFLCYFLNSSYSRQSLVALSNQVTMATIDQEKFKSLSIAIPSISEQQAIARFLDFKTAQIDALIAKKQTLLEKLAEKRTALISHAVTKGLDPTVPMKDSGVEWLGKIPAHWNAKRLKFVVSIFGGGTPNTGKSEYWNGDIPWVSPKDMKCDYIVTTEDYLTDLGVEESATKIVPVDSVLIVVRSGILRHTIPVARNTVEVTLNQDMKSLVTNDHLRPGFLHWLINGLQEGLLPMWSKQGCTVESIEMGYMTNTVIPIPPIDEQDTVLEHITRITAKLDQQAKKVTDVISALTEYRSSLITHAVTGKIDVRGWQVPQEAA